MQIKQQNWLTTNKQNTIFWEGRQSLTSSLDSWPVFDPTPCDTSWWLSSIAFAESKCCRCWSWVDPTTGISCSWWVCCRCWALPWNCPRSHTDTPRSKESNLNYKHRHMHNLVNKKQINNRFCLVGFFCFNFYYVIIFPLFYYCFSRIRFFFLLDFLFFIFVFSFKKYFVCWFHDQSIMRNTHTHTHTIKSNYSI